MRISDWSSDVCSSDLLGKVSPVHFFWGSFDLAVTRFSGRPAPLHPGGVPGLPDRVTREAYSHEVSSAGFWPGSDGFPQARSEEHTSELQSLMRISYAVFCLKKKKKQSLGRKHI